MNLNPSPTMNEESIAPELAQLVERLMVRLQSGQPIDLEELALEHPEHAGNLSQILPALKAMAELDRFGQEESLPEGQKGAETGVLGDFRIVQEVGRGGMGIVYEAEQISLGRRVALKVLPMASMLDSRRLQRFQNEARAAANLHHTNIVPVYSVGSERGVHYYAMQFIEGRTLADLIDELRRQSDPRPAAPPSNADAVSRQAQQLLTGQWSADPLPASSCDSTVHFNSALPLQAANAEPEDETGAVAAISTEPSIRGSSFFRSVAHLGVQIAEALDYAHSLAVVHRDIKPPNLLLDPRGTVWVADFGLAQIESDAGLTMTGDLLGTIRYMSPEQALGQHGVVDHRTDIYSLGVTLYELLTLQPAFAGKDRNQLLRQVVEREPTPLRQLNPAAPRDLETIVHKAMAKEPPARYGSARELAEDLQRFLSHEPIRAKRPGLFDRTAKWIRRHQPLVAGAGGSALLLLVMTVVFLSISNTRIHAEQERTRQSLEKEETARNDVEQQRKRAEVNYLKAREAVQQMLTRVADEELAAIPEMKEVRLRLLNDAALFYTELIKLSPRDALVYFERAEVYVLLAKYDKAIADYKKALKLQPQNAAFHLALAKQLISRQDVFRRDLKEGLIHAQRVIEMNPQSYDAHYRAAIAWVRMGFPKEAQPHVKKLQELGPKSTEARASLSYLYSQLGDLKAAIAIIREALEIEPTSSAALHRLSTLLAWTGKSEEALEAAEKAISLNPKPNGSDTIYYFEQRGDVYWSLGKQATALADWQVCTRMAPHRHYAYRRCGLAHFHFKDYAQALAAITKAVEISPADADNLTWISPNQVSGCPDEDFRQGMLKLYNRALRSGSGPPVVLAARGLLYRSMGREKEGYADLQKARQLAPDDIHVGWWYLDFCSAGASFLVDRDEWDNELAICQKFIDIQPAERMAIRANKLAWLLATHADPKVHRAQQALNLARKAAKLKPDEADNWRTLGAAHYRSGDWKASIASLRKSMELRKTGLASDRFFLAMAHWQLNDKVQARNYYEQAIAWMEQNAPQDQGHQHLRAEVETLLEIREE